MSTAWWIALAVAVAWLVYAATHAFIEPPVPLLPEPAPQVRCHVSCEEIDAGW